MSRTNETLETVRAYHAGWTSGNFESATRLLAETLQIEVPINHYPDKASFAKAVAGFGSLATHARLIAELAEGGEAVFIYDMDVQGPGLFRMAGHFSVVDRQIVRIRQIHDTAALRADGFA